MEWIACITYFGLKMVGLPSVSIPLYYTMDSRNFYILHFTFWIWKI